MDSLVTVIHKGLQNFLKESAVSKWNSSLNISRTSVKNNPINGCIDQKSIQMQISQSCLDRFNKDRKDI